MPGKLLEPKGLGDLKARAPAFVNHWKGWLVALVLLLMGCAGLAQDVKQEIRDDVREAQQKMAEQEKSYKQNEYLRYTSDNSDNWNGTDWSLWMDSQGGGH